MPKGFPSNYIEAIICNMVEIVQQENNILRKRARDVAIPDITSSDIKKILQDMKEALSGQVDGVAIAAPQINIPLRIFIVSGKVWQEKIDEDREQSEIKPKAEVKEKAREKDRVFINPVITKLSKRTSVVDEGCLSVRWKYGDVKRSTTATVKAYDEKGHPFTYTARGLLAQIFQHETDHLEGILFIDTAKNVRDIDPEEVKKQWKERA